MSEFDPLTQLFQEVADIRREMNSGLTRIETLLSTKADVTAVATLGTQVAALEVWKAREDDRRKELTTLQEDVVVLKKEATERSAVAGYQLSRRQVAVGVGSLVTSLMLSLWSYLQLPG